MTKNNLPANVVNPGTQGKKHEEAEKRVVYGGSSWSERAGGGTVK